MDRRSYPLWLLRDWPAFIGFLLSFWSLMFASFIAERRRMRAGRLSPREFATLAQSFALAESKLDHAIWRQAWRACGYSHNEATFTLFAAPTDGRDLCRRYLAYRQAIQHMEHLVIAYADDLRQRFNLSRADIGDPNAWVDPLRRAPRATSPSFAGGGRPPATRTVSCTADRRGRWRAASSGLM
jgi:hypothetical protein